MTTQNLRCKTCDAGTMYETKIHRLSGPSVVIGYMLLIPSILGILLSIGLAILSVVATASAPTAARESAREKLVEAGIESQLIDQITSLKIRPSDPELNRLTEDQQEAVSEAQQAVVISNAAGGVSLVVIGGGALCFGLSCFIGGLVGWLLTMTKKVLRCPACHAVVNAS